MMRYFLKVYFLEYKMIIKSFLEGNHYQDIFLPKVENNRIPEDEFENYYIDKIFESIWRDGLNMNDQNIIDKVLKNININPKTFFLRASGESVKNLLRKKTDEAFEKGVFGAPTFLVNNKIFWGQDRLEYAIDETKK